MKNYKILLDLSSAISGELAHSGIPQETRVMFKLFAENPGIKPIGLICGANLEAVTQQLSRSEDNVQQALSLTNYFLKLQSKPNQPKYKRAILLLKTLIKLFKQHYHYFPHNTEFSDFVWRKAFNELVDGQFRKLIMDQEFVISNFNKTILGLRILFNLPLPRLHTPGMDFAIFQQGVPIAPIVSPGTIPIVRFHDAVPLLFPDTTSNLRYANLHAKSILASSKNAIFVCNSEPVGQELLELLPAVEKRFHVIPVPLLTEGTSPEKNQNAIPAILASRRAKVKIKKRNFKGRMEEVEAEAETRFDPFKEDCSNYIISVSTLEPRKNYFSLIQAWERIRYLCDNQLKLIIVGSPGWKCKGVLDAMRPHIYNGDIVHLEKVPVYELRMLYACARAFVFPTYYEGFGNTPVEAMHAGCPVIVSDIPATRWVLGDAALYCDPYDITSIANAIERLLYSSDSQELCQSLIKKGSERVKRYSSEEVGKQWYNLFDRLKTSQHNRIKVEEGQ